MKVEQAAKPMQATALPVKPKVVLVATQRLVPGMAATRAMVAMLETVVREKPDRRKAATVATRMQQQRTTMVPVKRLRSRKRALVVTRRPDSPMAELVATVA